MWLPVLAWASLARAFGGALFIAVDILVRRYRQPMRIMEVVWPVTALYRGAEQEPADHRDERDAEQESCCASGRPR